jgi:glycosyltransferase involved in cell wall biosynthesis
MRILIATGVYPPEIGGPAYYAVGLAKALGRNGHEVEVSHYGLLKKFPTGVRHVLYTFLLFPKVIRADAVIALDTFSVGVPATFLSRLLRTPIVVRVGGDFLWEQHVEKTGEMIPLPDFYVEHTEFTLKEKIIFKLTQFVLNHSIVVFSTHWLREIWYDGYGFDKEYAYVIKNAVEKKLEGTKPKKKNFLFFARDITLKNKPGFLRAFAIAKKENPDIELEDGIVPKEELMEKMKNCYAVVLPSLSEVSPNYILDAIRLGKPFILTKYSGYAEPLGEYGLMVDPLDEEDMVEKILQLADGEIYKKLTKKILEFDILRTYSDIADEFTDLLTHSLNDGMSVVAIGSDRSLFDEDSPARDRQIKYGKLFEELHIVIFTKRSDKYEMENISDNVWIYPTNSLSRWLYVFDAIRISRRIDKDIVTTQDPFESGLVGLFSSHSFGASLHVQVHTDITSSEFVYGNFLNRIRRIIASWVIPKADCIRTVSRRIERGVEVKYRPLADVSILPIFVDLKEFAIVERKKHSRFKTTLLVVSRLEKEKNVVLAIRALHKARRTGNDAGLVVVGSGSQEEKLKALAEELNISEWVEFVGWQDPKKYYGMADLLLVPSHYEGYGMAIVEALALGVPVLSTDVGIAHEAGAIVAKEDKFESSLVDWFKNGSREGKLLYNPYKNEKEYLKLYQEDIFRCIR